MEPRTDTGAHIPGEPGTTHLGVAPTAEEPEIDSPLPDEQLGDCSDSALVAAIRQCEAIRHRVLNDQLLLLTEAGRRGLCLAPGPRPAPRTSPGPAAGAPEEDPPK